MLQVSRRKGGKLFSRSSEVWGRSQGAAGGRGLSSPGSVDVCSSAPEQSCPPEKELPGGAGRGEGGRPSISRSAELHRLETPSPDLPSTGVGMEQSHSHPPAASPPATHRGEVTVLINLG